MKVHKPKPKRKPRAVAITAAAATDKVCQNCVYYGPGDGTCRRNAPLAELSGTTPMTLWPRVAATDWCAQGYSHAADWYEPAPRRAPRD